MLPDFCQPNQEINKLTLVIVPNPVIQMFPLQRRTGWCCIRKRSLFVYRLTLTTPHGQNADHALKLRQVSHLLTTML